MDKREDGPQMRCKSCYSVLEHIVDQTAGSAVESLLWCPSCGTRCSICRNTGEVEWSYPELIEHHRLTIWALVNKYTQGAAELTVGDILSVPHNRRLETREGPDGSTIYLATKD